MPNKFVGSFKSRKQQKKQRKADKQWIQSRHKPLTLDEAAKRLNDDAVWNKLHVPKNA